mmetsp:Transcript_27623/g.83297  ORF Transcript_27623/g.83297 Transcript_27623/m.83297 type:complete len:298 (+) Transcript_27623:1922-2815(+)
MPSLANSLGAAPDRRDGVRGACGVVWRHARFRRNCRHRLARRLEGRRRGRQRRCHEACGPRGRLVHEDKRAGDAAAASTRVGGGSFAHPHRVRNAAPQGLSPRPSQWALVRQGRGRPGRELRRGVNLGRELGREWRGDGTRQQPPCGIYALGRVQLRGRHLDLQAPGAGGHHDQRHHRLRYPSAPRRRFSEFLFAWHAGAAFSLGKWGRARGHVGRGGGRPHRCPDWRCPRKGSRHRQDHNPKQHGGTHDWCCAIIRSESRQKDEIRKQAEEERCIRPGRGRVFCQRDWFRRGRELG